MRRYFFLSLSLIFVAIFFFSQHIPTTEAQNIAKKGQTCGWIMGCNEVACTSAFWECEKGTVCTTEGNGPGQKQVCRVPNEKPLTCLCQHEGQNGAGNNGFTCDGGPVDYCAHPDYACYNVPNNTVQSEKYPGKKLTGVQCNIQAGLQKATCHCIGKGTNGANNFECVSDSDPKKKGTGFCYQPSHMCIDKAGQPFSGAVSQKQGNLWDQDTKLVGIICEEPGSQCTCDNPSQPGSGKNGITCKGPDGKTDHTSCLSNTNACVLAPNFDTNRGSLKDRNILQGTTLKGVDCKKTAPPPPTPLPPPPSPPCKTWGTGQCLTFGTAIGDLQTQPGRFVATLFAVLLSFSGGIALLLIIKSGYQLLLSQGKPEQVQNGREQLIAAIVGLVFIVFSFIMLQIIGYDILKIPGFTP